MTTLRLWFANNRPWLVPVLLVGAMVAAIFSFAQLTNYVTGWAAQRHAVKRSSQILTSNAARQQADRHQQKTADSTINILEGKSQAAAAASQQSKKEYEKATIAQPAIPDLPRNPPRFRPGGR